MKLKYININKYGVVVDESVDIGEGLTLLKSDISKIICAEKELNLDVPVLPNWREWELTQIVREKYLLPFPSKWFSIMNQEAYKQRYAYIEGYNHNGKLYTKEDLKKAIKMAKEKYDENDIIQSLQKYPKYITVETTKDLENHPELINNPKEVREGLELITNSEGKQEVIIKEIIW
jgi:hypothetical protein